MANTRVYTLAKELGFESKLFVKELEKEGIKVKSHMSTVDDETVDLIMTLFKVEEKKSTPKKTPAKKKPSPKEKEKSKEEIVPEEVKPQDEQIEVLDEIVAEEETILDEEIEEEKVQEETEEETQEDIKTVAISSPVNKIKLGEVITISELAEKLKINSTDIIKHLMSKGEMTTLNQSIDFKTASNVCDYFECEVE